MLLATGTAGHAAPQSDAQHVSAAMQHQAPTAAALQQPQQAGANKRKPPTGLKRGFLSGASSQKSKAHAQPSSAARQGKSQSADGAQIQTDLKSQAAFTGSVVEHSDLPTDRQAAAEQPRGVHLRGPAGTNVPAATRLSQAEAATKRVSKFKQSRSAM